MLVGNQVEQFLQSFAFRLLPDGLRLGAAMVHVMAVLVQNKGANDFAAVHFTAQDRQRRDVNLVLGEARIAELLARDHLDAEELASQLSADADAPGEGRRDSAKLHFPSVAGPQALAGPFAYRGRV